MRLTIQQQQQLVAMVREAAGAHAQVWVYGSRLDDTRKGGDLDLLIQSDPPLSTMQRARLKVVLERTLQLPVDVLVSPPGPARTPFAAIALATGAPLVRS